MGAKMSGVPWAIDNLPFTEKPTMIVSYDTKNKSNNNVFSIVSTMDSQYCSYWSNSKIIDNKTNVP